MKRLIITRILTLNFIIPRDFWKMKYKALAIKKPLIVQGFVERSGI